MGVNVGDKYIIEIEDIVSSEKFGTLYKAKNFRTLIFDDIGLSKLEKLDNKSALDMAYEMGHTAGMNMVWHAMKKASLAPESTMRSLLDIPYWADLSVCLVRLTPEEFIKRMSEYEEDDDLHGFIDGLLAQGYSMEDIRKAVFEAQQMR